MKKQKLNLFKILVIEVLIIGVFVSLGMVITRGRNSVAIPVDQWVSAYTSYEDGAILMSPEKMANGPQAVDYDKSQFDYLTDGEVVAFSSPTVTLPKGDYTLTVNYGTNVRTSAGITVDEKCKPYITTGRMNISRGSNVLVYHITAKEDITAFRVDVFYQNEGTIYITGASLDPNANGVKRGLFLLLLFSVLFDIVYIKRQWFASHQTRVMMMAVAVILASLPLAAPNIIYGHDIMFHFNRIEGIAQALMQHQFPVRMYPEWMDGFGYPTPIYYGDFLLYFPAIMRVMGFTLIASYKAYIVFVNVITVTVSYVCFRRIFRDYKIAVICACAYLLATYRMVDIYTRAAVGEYTAMIFLPLIAMAMYRIYADSTSNWKQYRYNAFYLALGMSGLLCTHILSTEMAIVTLVLVALFFARYTFTPRRLRAIGTAVLGTCVFSAWYIVPFLYHFLFVPTRINSGNVMKVFAAENGVSTIDGLANYFSPIQANGAYVSQLFNVFGYPFGFGSTEVYERSALTPGLVLMGTLLVAGFYWCRGRANAQMKRMTVLSVVLLWMSTNLFPWDFLGLKVSRLFTTFEIPSRFISMANICLAVLLGFTLLQIKKTKNLPQVFGDPEEDADWEETMKRFHNRRFRMVLLAAMVGCVFSSLIFIRDALDYDFMVNVNDSAELNTVKGNAFVCLRDGSTVTFPMDLTTDEEVQSAEVLSNSGSNVTVHVDTTQAGFVEVPKLRYPGYVAYDESGNRLKLVDGTNNVIRIQIPGAYSGNIMVSWKEPISWRIAELITVLGLLFYWITWLRRPSTYRSFGK